MNALSFVSMGAEARCHPCHSAAHLRHMKRQPSHCHCRTRPGHHHCNRCCHLRQCCRLCCHRHCHCPSPLPSATCHCGCHRPLPLLSLLHCHQPSLLPSPLPSAIAVSVTVGHRSSHLCWASLLPSPSAISESCCLGAARIVFNQLKQRMLTLFYFVWTVGGALIKAGLDD